jgi:FtsP/CotA-like multicopper oxidase with cupredoxin domain
VFRTCRPNYLADLRATPVGNVAPTRQIEVRANINGVLFPEDGTPLFEMGFDQVQQWIIGGTEAHPSHLHVAHMQLQNAAAQWADVPGFFKAGDWLDTVSLPGQATVRFRTERFGGDYFFHCHVYEHSDSGVMATVRVPYGPQGPHPSPAFQKYGTCPNVSFEFHA